jgi:hypothetical protein
MTAPSITPFALDCAAVAIAERAGLRIERRMSIEITDQAALAAAGLTVTKEAPDYGRLRRLLADGANVPGAQLAGVEYVLRPSGGAAQNGERP